MGTKRIHFQSFDRQLEIIDGAGRRGQVQHPIQMTWNMNGVAHVVMNKFEFRVALVLVDILCRTGDQIVDHDRFVTVSQQPVDQMGADESGTTSDGRSEPDHIDGPARAFTLAIAARAVAG